MHTAVTVMPGVFAGAVMALRHSHGLPGCLPHGPSH